MLNSKSKQGILPLFISDFLDIDDMVFTFDQFLEGIDLNQYLNAVLDCWTGRTRYHPVNMLKTVLFGFMQNGYMLLRELEEACRMNLRFMFLMDNAHPSYRTFGYFINEILAGSVEDIFYDINKKIFEEEHVDLQHLYINGSNTEDIDNELAYMTPEELHKEYGEENFDGSIYKAQDFMFDMQNKLLTAISFSFFIQLRGLSEYPSSIIESKAFPEDMREFLHIYQKFANNDVSIGEDSEVAEDEKKESKETEKPKLHPVR